MQHLTEHVSKYCILKLATPIWKNGKDMPVHLISIIYKTINLQREHAISVQTE